MLHTHREKPRVWVLTIEKEKKKKKKKFERSVSLEMFCHSEGQNRTRSPESTDRVISIKY